MRKHLSILLFIGIFILRAIPVFAIESTVNENAVHYPNFSDEFVGRDKFESFNRKAFVFYVKANKYVRRPISIVWASVMPKYGMERISNFYANMKYPLRLTSSLLQGDIESAGIETKRFLINSTVGFVGLFDPALKKYNMAPRNEDMGQVLAHYNVKQGPYLIVPFVAQGNIRDFVGQSLNKPLNLSAYIGGDCVLSSVGSNLSSVTSMTYMQPLLSVVDNYADSYEASKQLNGINQYIKNNNLDRRNFKNEANISKNFVNIDSFQNSEGLDADIKLNRYNPQAQESDSLRTILFDAPQAENSRWSELSVWNKTFTKQIKTSSIKVTAKHPRYSYRYVLQEDKSAPIAVIYPSFGEGVMSNQSVAFARLLYNEGYSVVILGSSFNWAFVKSMPDNFRPGLLSQDAHYMRIVTSIALSQLQGKFNLKPDKKIVVGISYGALTGLFVDEQEQREKNALGISEYICISPPIQALYALQQVDKYSNGLKQADLKEEIAITMEKLIQSSLNEDKNVVVALPFTDDEAKMAISYAMRQKLFDLIFTVEKGKVSINNDIYESFCDMDFNGYIQKYLVSNKDKTINQLAYDSSLYPLADFLKNSNNYKIYHSLDDCFSTQKDLIWLKKQTKDKTVLFSNGSHLGFLYRTEFLDEFIKDIKIKNAVEN